MRKILTPTPAGVVNKNITIKEKINYNMLILVLIIIRKEK